MKTVIDAVNDYKGEGYDFSADDWSSIEDIASDLFDSFLIQPLTVEVK